MLMRQRISPVLCALTLLAASSGVTAQEAEPRPPRDGAARAGAPGAVVQGESPSAATPGPLARPRPRPSRPPLSSAIQPTHLQVDVYELTCKAADLAKLDTESLARTDGGSRQAIWDRLGQIGTVRVLALSDNVLDLVRDASLSQSQNAPVVSSMTTGRDGKAVPSIEYQGIGLKIETVGEWHDDADPPTARLRLNLKLSGGSRSNVTISDKLKLPAFDKLDLSQNLTLISGRPVVFLGNDVPTPYDAGEVRANVVRVVAHRLPDARPAREANQEPEPEITQPTRVRIDWYELHCPAAELLTLASRLAGEGGTPASTLAFLGSIGQARAAGFIDNACDLSRRTVMTNARNVPIVRGVTVDKGGHTTPSVNYNSVGIKAKLIGRWRTEDDGTVLDLDSEVEISDIVESGAQNNDGELSLPAFTRSSIDQSKTLRADRPVFVIATHVPSPDGGDAGHRVTVIRIQATPLPGADLRAEREAEGLGQANSRVEFDIFELTCDAVQPATLSAQDLEQHAATQAMLLARLDELGDVRLVCTVDQTADLSSELNHNKSRETPVVTGVKTSPEGVSTPSVSYRSVGFSIRMNGLWRDAEPVRGDIWYDLDYSGISETGVELAPDVRLSAYERMSVEQSCVLASGEPVVIVTQGVQPDHGERMAPIVTVMRIMSERLAEAIPPAPTSADHTPSK